MSRCCGTGAEQSDVSSFLVMIWVTGAVCRASGGEGVSTLRFFDLRDQIVLSSMQMISPASIGVDVTDTSATVKISSGLATGAQVIELRRRLVSSGFVRGF